MHNIILLAAVKSLTLTTATARCNMFSDVGLRGLLLRKTFYYAYQQETGAATNVWLYFEKKKH